MQALRLKGLTNDCQIDKQSLENGELENGEKELSSMFSLSWNWAFKSF